MLKKIILMLAIICAFVILSSSMIVKNENTKSIEESINLVEYYNENPDILEERVKPEKEAKALAIVVDTIAPNCDDTCKEAIMQCILNRVHTKGFPDSIEQVCYAQKQFSGVSQHNIFTDESFQFAKRFLRKQDNIYIAKIETNMVYLSTASQGVYFKTDIDSKNEIYIPYNSV